MDILAKGSRSGGRPDLDELIAAIPYCRFLGIAIDRKGSEITTILPYSDHLIGNATLPALHGGVLGAFMEVTAILQIAFDAPGPALPKPVDITIDYLRSGRPVDTFGRAHITKLGRRVINVHVETWQDEHTRPIAALRGHFLVAGGD
ncbi:MAG: PaaI family thioesterase [Alphaproteobacteria bacterium]|nr:PaaI family thioesterase [Alphaproteobacteria bacterium]